jgi:hypothetical protein
VSTWTSDELDRIGTTRELRIAGLRADGTRRDPVIIWAVRVDDDVYVRSVNGPEAAWFRGTRPRMEGWISSGGVEREVAFQDVPASDPINERIDAAYRAKFGAGSRSVAAITNATASSTTLRVLPR